MSTNRIEWHAAEEDLGRYLAGGCPPVLAASIEAHLMGCADCRGRLGRVTGEVEQQAAWAMLADTIDRPSRGPLARLTGGHWFARSAVATPAMLQAALGALLLIGLVPLLAATLIGDGALVALLVLAPLAPVAAVALAYRDWSDPAGEISLATPTAGLRLVALRAVLVSAAALPLAFLMLGAVELWLDDVPSRLALAWCLPGLALAALVMLAGTTRLDPTYVAVTLSAAWTGSVAVAVVARRSLRPEIFVDVVASPALQTAALAVAVTAVLTTVVRRDAVAYRRTS